MLNTSVIAQQINTLPFPWLASPSLKTLVSVVMQTSVFHFNKHTVTVQKKIILRHLHATQNGQVQAIFTVVTYVHTSLRDNN